MALFFDQQWFTQRLEALDRTPNELADAMGLPLVELAAIWKDQRELTPDDVRAMAAFLETPVAEVASRAGVSTPAPLPRDVVAHDVMPQGDGPQPDLSAVLARLDDMAHRLDKLERAVGDIKALVLETRFTHDAAVRDVPRRDDNN